MLCSTLCSFLVWYTTLVAKTYSFRSLIYSIVLTYCGDTCSTSSLSKSSSHSSWFFRYWSETDYQTKPLSMDLVSIPPYVSWYICDISSDLYKMPCLWVDRLISVLSRSLHYKFVGVTLGALSPQPSGSIFGGFSFIGNLVQTLDCFIALPVNASQGSITIADNTLYRVGCSSVLGILGMIYHTLYGIWNYIASFVNGNYPSTTFSFSFYYMATWSNYLCKL